MKFPLPTKAEPAAHRVVQDKWPLPKGSGLRPALNPKSTLALLKATYLEWSNDKVLRMSAALAYYAIFSLTPLLVIAVAIVGLAFGVDAAQGEITAQIQSLVGYDGARTIQRMIESAHKPTSSAVATTIGFLALLLGA